MLGRLKYLLCFLVTCLLVVSGFAQACSTAVSSEATVTNACPFCTAVGQTISEKIDEADVVVLAVLKNQPRQNILNDDDELPKGKFEIIQVLRGDKYVAVGDKFESLLVGRYALETPFMVIGVDAPTIAWSTPMKMTEKSKKYVNDVMKLPKSGGDRLKFFQNYLQSEESMLAYDAYDEFARAPYADLIEMKDEMIHDDLIKWIQDPEIPVNRKRLYYTMLGVCATKKDVPLFEDILKSGDRKRQRGLDALVACYLNITGKDGLALVNKEFLKNQDAEYVDVFAVISALRFHGAETDKIKKEELVKSMRLVLDRPKMADMVIPDLARWEDWTVAEKLVEMFKTPPKESSSFIRVPIVSYLLACPKPEAKKFIEECRKVDAESVLRAEKMLQWEMGLDDWDDDDSDDDDTDKKDDTKKENKNSKADGSSKDDESNSQRSGKNPFDDKGIDDKGIDDKGIDDKGNVESSVSLLPRNSDTSVVTAPTSSSGGVGTLSFQQDPVGEFESGGNLEWETDDADKPEMPNGEAKTNRDESSSTVEGKTELVVPISNGNSEESFVSTPVPGNTTTPEINSSTNLPEDRNVENQNTAPVATQTWQGTAAMVMIPMTVCIFLFLLSWSVINGWFERLIY